MTEWFADDAFWMDVFPFEFGETAMAAGEGQIERAIALSGVERGDALDLGCGPGRHAVALAKRGFRVTAVDLSAFHVGKARERAAEAGVAIDFVEADARAFVRPDSFDLALSIFTSFGYFDDAQDDLRVLQNLHWSLKPGGALVMDVISKERVARYEFHLRVYSGQELKTVLAAAGFRQIRLFGGFDGRPYGADPERLIVAATK